LTVGLKKDTGMATRSSSSSLDVQKLLGGAVKLELKLLNAGVETIQVYINQASRLSSLASETLQAIQDDKASLSETARKLTAFGRQNAQAFADLSQKLSASYYGELDRIADNVLKPSDKVDPAATAAATPPRAQKPRRQARKTRRA
jgi:hypothetical protein